MVALAVMGLLLGKLNLERRYADRSDPHLTSISLEGNIATVLRENAIPDSSRFIVLGSNPEWFTVVFKQEGLDL